MGKKEKLNWDEKFSVGVEEIDGQHKVMINTINNLIEAINSSPTEEKLSKTIELLIEYKKNHFKTEEDYFEKYKFEGSAEHIAEHKKFEERLSDIQVRSGGNIIMLAFELVDFLEDWLIDHLMNTDQKYVECFRKAGLK